MAIHLHKEMRRCRLAAFAMVNVQVVLGNTILYLVPVPFTTTRQADSAALSSTVLHILLALRRPGTTCRRDSDQLRHKKRQQIPKAPH